MGLTVADIEEAHAAIAPHIVRTPLVRVPELGKRVGCDLFLKLENLQLTGAFKIRGALNRMLRMSPEECARGVITVSTGNHALGVAYAASLLGIRATVVMAESASPYKAEGTRRLGARVILHGTVHQALLKMEEIRRAEGCTYVSLFDDPLLVAGQGTVGLEILQDCPDPDLLLVACGSGGLAAGIAVATKSKRPGMRIVTVEPEGAPKLWRSLREGKVIHLEKIDTIADGIAIPFCSELNFHICRQLVDDAVLVTDEEIRQAVQLLLDRARILTEPAGAVAFAALLGGKVKVSPDEKVIAVVTGGNVGLERLKSFL